MLRIMPHEVDDVEFARLVESALSQLPEAFRQAVEQDVPIQVVPRPTPLQLAELEIEENDLLLGLFEGPSLMEQKSELSAIIPARIWLFKEDIEDISENAADLVEQVRITLLHELGHYFGMDEDDLDRVGYG
jgi:predicted Zn-dependent protease with MMP-like domain